MTLLFVVLWRKLRHPLMIALRLCCVSNFINEVFSWSSLFDDCSEFPYILSSIWKLWVWSQLSRSGFIRADSLYECFESPRADVINDRTATLVRVTYFTDLRRILVIWKFCLRLVSVECNYFYLCVCGYDETQKNRKLQIIYVNCIKIWSFWTFLIHHLGYVWRYRLFRTRIIQ